MSIRRLLVLRHSKAAPLVAGDDFDRDLTPRGEADAERIGDYIASEGLQTDVVIYSGARRTRETALIALARWGRATQAIEQNALYEATWRLILELLRGLPDDAASAMIVGHNPGIGEIANVLTGEGDASERLRMAAKFPTSALAVLAYDGAAWRDLAPRLCRLEHFVTPSSLGAQ